MEARKMCETDWPTYSPDPKYDWRHPPFLDHDYENWCDTYQPSPECSKGIDREPLPSEKK